MILRVVFISSCLWFVLFPVAIVLGSPVLLWSALVAGLVAGTSCAIWLRGRSA